MRNTKEEAKQFIENGGNCYYRYGWAFKGAGAKKVTKEWALENLNKYAFGMGFYELSWRTIDNETALEFNELSENDMY